MTVAFHNKQLIKDFYMDRLQVHYESDELIKGTYWEEGKGCAVGCLVHQEKDTHQAVEKELGFPLWLAFLMDRLFEGQQNGDAKVFPINIVESIPVGFTGKQFNLVRAKFFHWLLVDKDAGVIQFAIKESQQKAINDVAQLYHDVINGIEVKKEQWQGKRAADAAAYAAAAAAYADAAAYAAAAAAAAAYAAAAAAAAADAAAAAAAAAAADAADAAKSKHFKLMADKLVSLFKAA